MTRLNNNTYRSLLEQVEGNSIAADTDSQFVVSNIQALNKAGYIYGMLPEEKGGLSLSLREINQVMIELAYRCPPTAWNFAIFCSHAWLSASLPDPLFNQVASNHQLISSSLNPKMTKTSGQLTISAKYISGVTQADWILLQSTPPDQDSPWLFLPTQNIKITGQWAPMGLSTTDSFSIQADIPSEDVVYFDHKKFYQSHPEKLNTPSTSDLIRSFFCSFFIGNINRLTDEIEQKCNPELPETRDFVDHANLLTNTWLCTFEKEIGRLKNRHAGNLPHLSRHIAEASLELMLSAIKVIGTRHLQKPEKIESIIRNVITASSHHYLKPNRN